MTTTTTATRTRTAERETAAAPLPDAVRQLLARYETAHSGRFVGLTLADAERILDLIPAQEGVHVNTAPTFGQFLALGRRYPAMTFSGDHVGAHADAAPRDRSEALLIDTVELPLRDLSAEDYVHLQESLPTPPAEWDILGAPGQREVRIWWD